MAEIRLKQIGERSVCLQCYAGMEKVYMHRCQGINQGKFRHVKSRVLPMYKIAPK